MTRNQQTLKEAMKAALIDVLREERDLPQDVFADAWEEVGLAKAIEEGRRSRKVSREAVFKALRDSP